MKILVLLLSLIYSLGSVAADYAVFVDVNVFIKRSPKKYKYEIGKFFKDRESKLYFYLPKYSDERLMALSELDNVDIYLISNKDSENFNWALNNLGIKNAKIKGFYFTNGSRFYPNNHGLNLSQYKGYKFFGYDTNLFYPNRREMIDLGDEKYIFLSNADSDKQYERTSKKKRNGVRHLFLGRTSPDIYENQQYELAYHIMNFTNGLDLNERNQTNRINLGKEYFSEAAKGVQYKWNAKTQKIGDENIKVVDKCIAYYKDGSNQEKADKYCGADSKKTYQWIGKNGSVYKCYENKGGFASKEVSESLCKRNLRSDYKWQVKNKKVTGCDLYSRAKNLLIENTDLNNCLRRLNSTYNWKYDESAKKVIGCFRTTDAKDFLDDKTIDNCKTNLKTKVNFQTDNNQFVTGCFVADRTKGYEIETLDSSKCKGHARLQMSWEYSSDNTKVIGCKEIDRNTNNKFPGIKTQDCIKKFGVRYHFEHANSQVTQCNMVTNVSRNQKFIKKMNDYKECETYAGVKFEFEKDQGKVSACIKRSKYKNLLIEKMSNLTECISNLSSQITTDFAYNATKTKVNGCTTKLKSGEVIPGSSATNCPQKTILIKDNTHTFINGCKNVVPHNGMVINSQAMNKCISDTSTLKAGYLIKHNQNEIDGCYLLDSVNSLPIKAHKKSLDTCRADTKSLFLYRGMDKKECLEFFETDQKKLIKIARANLNDCSDQHVLYDKELKIYVPIAADKLDKTKTYEENINEFGPAEIKIAKKYIEDLKKYVLTTDRTITTYNYRKRSLVEGNKLKINNTGPVNMQNQIVVDYAKEWMQAFWNYLPKESGMIGWGLYTANNPIQSKSYGDTYWAMVTVDLPKGSNLLDVRRFKEKIPVSKDAYNMVRKHCSISSSDYQYISAEEIVAINKVKMTNCLVGHKALTLAFKKLKINAIAYYWDWNNDYSRYTRPRVCNTSNREGTFVIVDTPLNKDTVKLVVQNGVVSPTKAETLWYSNINSLMSDFGHNARITMPTMKAFTTSDSAYQTWKKSSQFTCSKDFETSDKMIK